MSETKTDFSVEWEPNNPFVIDWKDDSFYNLYYKGKIIGDGRAPKELLDSYVEIMNFAYREGKLDG
jgi:hypothetical protein